MTRTDGRSAIFDALTEHPYGRTLREVAPHHSGGRVPTPASESALGRGLWTARQYGAVEIAGGVGVDRRDRLTEDGPPLV